MLNQTARTVAQHFIDHVLTKHGAVNKVTTDNGKQFVCSIFKELAEIYGFTHRTTTPYHQSSNGQVEKQNLTIANMLRGTLASGGEEWPELLQMVLFAFNTSVQTSIKQSPFFVLHGREPRLPSDVTLQLPKKAVYADVSTFTQDLLINIQTAWRIVKENIGQLQEEYASQADTSRKAVEGKYTIGQLVLHKVHVTKHKFAAKFKGPYRIIFMQRPNVILRELAPEAVPFKTHMNMIKPFYDPYVLPLRSMLNIEPENEASTDLDDKSNAEPVEKPAAESIAESDAESDADANNA
uniref:Integrase catalytic domain-containing protein n=1 Tax=Panagrolaimus davidi TaxID=227884 RepID=A0A914QGA1_9BILA